MRISILYLVFDVCVYVRTCVCENAFCILYLILNMYVQEIQYVIEMYSDNTH